MNSSAQHKRPLSLSANCPGCGMLMVAPHGTLPDADADGYCPGCQKERASAASDDD